MKKKVFLETLLNSDVEDQWKYWAVFDWSKRELFAFIKGRITQIDWEGNFLGDLEDVKNNIFEEWKQIEQILLNYDSFPIKRLKGVLYEILFFLDCIKTSLIFKGSWIMELAGDPLMPNKEPPWFEIIPIYDILPNIFRIKENNKWILKAPQIESDFIICYWDEKGSLPLAFIDVKKNLKNYNKQTSILHALGCKYFCNSILQIACPEAEYPNDLKEWNIQQVCWSCGSLNENAIYCRNCRTKIWIAEKEAWDNYPLR